MNQNRLGLLPSNLYHCTLRQSYRSGQNPDMEGDDLVLIWTVDSGEHKWRNLKRTFSPDSDLDLWNLRQMAKRLNFEMFPPDHEDFYDQWVGLRAKLDVAVDLSKDSRFKKNVVLEYKLPTRPPEINVLQEKDNSHFYENTNERQLPI